MVVVTGLLTACSSAPLPPVVPLAPDASRDVEAGPFAPVESFEPLFEAQDGPLEGAGYLMNRAPGYRTAASVGDRRGGQWSGRSS